MGADNARKFLQMGTTRAARYANHKGGRKYVDGTGEKGKKVKKMQEGDWEGRAEKKEASNIFREYWQMAKTSERYVEMKEEHVKRTKEWEKQPKARERR